MRTDTRSICFGCFLILVFVKTQAQYTIHGKVYDSSGLHTLESVSVLCSCGKATFTDSSGLYSITAGENDSIWFSYLGKSTPKYPVRYIHEWPSFDIALKVSIPVLKEVIVRQRNYKLDSIQNRQDYAKVFNYRKPSFWTIVRSISITGFVIDLDELIRAFQVRKIRGTLKFKQRLLQQEKDKFVDRRFNKPLIRLLTGLDGSELDSFMIAYRPDYKFTLGSSDYDFREYIVLSYKQYLSSQTAMKKPE